MKSHQLVGIQRSARRTDETSRILHDGVGGWKLSADKLTAEG
jgi:hypothetical protein